MEYIHSRNFIHRGIELDDPLMGVGKRSNQVNVIDCGLANTGRGQETYLHIRFPSPGQRGRLPIAHIWEAPFRALSPLVPCSFNPPPPLLSPSDFVVAPMPKATFKDIQLTLLKEYGLAVQVLDDGTFDIKEKTGRSGGLPVRKSRPIKVHATSEPGGSVSRGKFNLQSMMHLSDADYKLVCNSAKEVINQTRRIDKDLSFQKQDPNVIELCVDKLIERHPELHAYDLHNRWGPRAFFKKLLQTSSCKANAISKLEKDLAKLEATVKEEQARNQPAGGKQVVVPQDAVDPGAAAQQQAAAPAAMPAKKRGRPKRVRSPEPESKPVIDSAPVVVAPPAPSGAPATVAQPDPGVIAQPPPPVMSQPCTI
ncbi:serine/threonine protein kinase [Ceratobasidium sp. 395]|nr:serine/threonine protein kinase [Ceratobasidium sp. 395]